jgi:hypothetical protein
MSGSPSPAEEGTGEEPRVVRQTSARASRIHKTGKPVDGPHTDDQEQQPVSPSADRTADRSAVGWRYGSALAAARALNARPVQA